MEQRELMEPRQVVDEVVDAHVESEVAYLKWSHCSESNKIRVPVR